MSTTTAPPMPRGARRIAAIIVAVLLLVVAAFAVWQAILIQLGRVPVPFNTTQITDYLGRTRWNDVAVKATGIVLAVVGLWLVLLGIISPRRTLIELTEPDPKTSTGISDAHLRRALSRAAESIDGIDAARTRVSRGKATITAYTPLGDPTGLAEQVHAVVSECLRQLDPTAPLDVVVHMSGKDQR